MGVFPVQDRLIEVVDGKMTGEVLLDETLKLMKGSERMSTAQWVDLLSGELLLLWRVNGGLLNHSDQFCYQARHGTLPKSATSSNKFESDWPRD